MTDQDWPPELRDFYEALAPSEGARDNIVEMRSVIVESRRWKRIAFMLAAACLVAFTTSAFVFIGDSKGEGASVHTDVPDKARYDLIAVRVHRDWCGKCKSMGNVFAEIQNDLNEERILFLTFDLTSSETTRQSLVISDELQISKPLDGVESGNIVLLDPTGRHIETLDGNSGRQFLADRIATRL